jgi:predicted RNA-binding Zn-ribbon protein involved in translation (DUF1610 family)
MPQFRFCVEPDLQQTLAARPTCTCGMQMWLSRLMPALKPGEELRVFECPVCGRTEHNIVDLRD